MSQPERLASAAERARRGGHPEIAVMGLEAAVDAVFYNAIQGIADPEKRQRFVTERGEETERDVDSLRPASDLVIDAVVEPSRLRDELLTRLACAAYNVRDFPDRRHGVPPV